MRLWDTTNLKLRRERTFSYSLFYIIKSFTIASSIGSKNMCKWKRNLDRRSRLCAAVCWSKISKPTILWLYFFVIVGQCTPDLLEAPFWRCRTDNVCFKFPTWLPIILTQTACWHNCIFAWFKFAITSFVIFLCWKCWHVFPICSDSSNVVNAFFKQCLIQIRTGIEIIGKECTIRAIQGCS